MRDAVTIPPARIPEPPSGWFDYQFTVLMDGRLALIRADRDILFEIERWWQLASKNHGSRFPSFADAWGRISIFDGNQECKVVELPLGEYPVVDQLADGRWLIASARCCHGDANAKIFGANGALEHSFCLGDGIADIACAPDGTFWVGYFDEGIFGSGDETEVLGTAGIARFDADGTRLWRFNQQDRWMVDDCYAMSLTNNDLWACVYVDFPIVRVRAGAVASWANPIGGPTAIAANDEFVILAGSYEDREQVVLLRIGDRTVDKVARRQLPARERFRPSLVVGRDAILHAVIDGSWHRISIDTWRTSIGE